TFGRGGHSRALLAELSADARLVGIDRDPQALAEGAQLHASDARFSMLDGNFADCLPTLSPASWSGVLFDLGVSSPQLDQAERGFSFGKDGPLDMRMDPRSGVSAADWLAQASETDIADALYHYGEERAARRIARVIVARRAQAPLTRTVELAELVASQLPRQGRTHPATRTFQALRIVVNDELGALERGLESAVELLEAGGRLAVISFHSLEDRAVKRFLQKAAKAPATNRRLPPGANDFVPTLRLVGRYEADETELTQNPRARSARLRVAERLADHSARLH
ncbi:MAG: 16S rRNA (cytosine(1402)-N(4))-methyltransferase RsmH, partial [Xanthomonadales bacterium]|nr:16S rRNA (cytosine(1402)-N(4))-methyltransferase RsmH [Xanthomonadales bacterium]